MQPVRRGPVVATGIVVLAVPLVALAVRASGLGFILFFLVVPFVLIAGPLYATNIVIVWCAMLRRGAELGRAPNRVRGLSAALLASVLLIVTVVFAVDGGEVDYPSLLLLLLGETENDALRDPFNAVSMTALVGWVLAWAWFIVEWVVALRWSLRMADGSRPSTEVRAHSIGHAGRPQIGY